MQRRMTLGPLAVNDSRMQNSLYQPTAKSRQSMGAPRLSMGPSRNTNSKPIGEQFSGMSLSQNATDSRASIGRRTSVNNNGRLSTAYGGRQSLAPNNNGPQNSQKQIFKDPRNIRSKPWQYGAIRNLIEYLLSANYDAAISPQILNAPSIKDFQRIFQFLYAKVDSGFQWNKKRFEEEISGLMKAIKYPFADQITKTVMQAVGSPHAWPSCLATLTWLVELISICHRMDEELAQHVPTAVSPEKIFANFLSQSYRQFLAGDDDFEAMDAVLADGFHDHDKHTMQQGEILQKANAAMEEELKKLNTRESPLARARAEKEMMVNDLEKMDAWNEQSVLKHAQLVKQVDQCKVEKSQLNASKQERSELTVIVDAQNMSPADIDRMINERDQLIKGIEQTNTTLAEIKKVNWEREIGSSKKMDQVEKKSGDFNNRAYRLGLIPTSAANAHGINFDVRLNSNAVHAEDIVQVDLRGTIKNALGTLRSSLKSQGIKVEEATMATRESAERLTDSLSDKLDQNDQLAATIQKIQDTLEMDKETAAVEMRAKSEEMDSMERELRRLKVEGTRGFFDIQKTAREVTIEYENLVRRTGEQKEKLVKGTLKALEDTVEFKARITAALIDVEKSLAEELGEVEMQ